MTIDETNYLISLEKRIIEGDQIKDSVALNLAPPINTQYTLTSIDGSSLLFTYKIWQSEKKTLKATLFLLDKEENRGLIRIDYGIGHINPQEITTFVPQELTPYAGMRIKGSHIHYHVPGYKDLVWAIPLDDDQFEVKQITDKASIANAIQAFSRKINLTTQIIIPKTLL